MSASASACASESELERAAARAGVSFADAASAPPLEEAEAAFARAERRAAHVRALRERAEAAGLARSVAPAGRGATGGPPADRGAAAQRGERAALARAVPRPAAADGAALRAEFLRGQASDDAPHMLHADAHHSLAMRRAVDEFYGDAAYGIAFPSLRAPGGALLDVVARAAAAAAAALPPAERLEAVQEARGALQAVAADLASGQGLAEALGRAAQTRDAALRAPHAHLEAARHLRALEEARSERLGLALCTEAEGLAERVVRLDARVAEHREAAAAAQRRTPEGLGCLARSGALGPELERQLRELAAEQQAAGACVRSAQQAERGGAGVFEPSFESQLAADVEASVGDGAGVVALAGEPGRRLLQLLVPACAPKGAAAPPPASAPALPSDAPPPPTLLGALAEPRCQRLVADLVARDATLTPQGLFDALRAHFPDAADGDAPSCDFVRRARQAIDELAAPVGGAAAPAGEAAAAARAAAQGDLGTAVRELRAVANAIAAARPAAAAALGPAAGAAGAAAAELAAESAPLGRTLKELRAAVRDCDAQHARALRAAAEFDALATAQVGAAQLSEERTQIAEQSAARHAAARTLEDKRAELRAGLLACNEQQRALGALRGARTP
jgi:hypothetical protein